LTFNIKFTNICKCPIGSIFYKIRIWAVSSSNKTYLDLLLLSLVFVIFVMSLI